MKTTLLITTALLSISAAKSQITITDADIVSPLDLVIQSNDTIPSVASPSGGANQIWDYSTGLVEHEQSSLSFTNPDWLTNASYFPSATMGAIDQDGFELFFEKNATSFGLLGFAGDIFGTGDKQIYLDPADILLQLPANYNDSYTTNSIQNVSFLGSDVGAPVDSIINRTYTTKTVLIDAWGSMTTPYGTFDVLRISETSLVTDSTWLYNFGIPSLFDNNINTNYSYTFYSDNLATRFPVLEMAHDNAGTVLNVTWLQGAPAVGLGELTELNSMVYPNPAIDIVTVDIKNNDITKIEIYQMDGSLLLSNEILKQTTLVDVSSLQSGVYIYKLLDLNNNIISMDKVVINN